MYKRQVLKKAGVASMPKTWDEFFVAAEKVKKAGLIPVAHGGQNWQDFTTFESVVLGIGGAKFYNDALVKLTLNYVQFAKDHGLIKEMVEEDVRSQMPMLVRTGKFIQQTGMKELALVAMTDRTACFYQLAIEVKREPGKVSFKSPYGTVLAATRQLGMHNLTEKELHEIWTKPRFEQQAAVMGVNVEVSDWRDDGWVTLSIAPEKVASR